MYQIPGVFSAATTTPAPAMPRVQPTRGPPPGSPQAREGSSATALAEAEYHERLAVRLNDVVVHPLFTAGVDLQAALGLIGDHPASSKICHAVAELDQAIQDIKNIRDTILDHLAGQRPPR
jgi:hypothetical protein